MRTFRCFIHVSESPMPYTMSIISEYRKLYKSTSTLHLRHLLVDNDLSVDDKCHIIACEHLLRGGRYLSRSRRECLRRIIMDQRQSHDELYEFGSSRYDIRANSKMLRNLGIRKSRGYPCSAKTKRGYHCRNRSKYYGRKCPVHKRKLDPSLFFDTEDYY